MSLKRASKAYVKTLSNARFLSLSLIPALLIGGILSFFTNGSFYYIRELGLSEWEYTAHQILIMGCNCLFSFLAGRFILKYGIERISKLGMKLAMSGGFSFLIATFFYPTHPYIMTIPMMVFASGVGFGFSSVTAMAMNLTSESSGVASALLTLIRATLIGVVITFSSFLYRGQALEIGIIVTFTSFISILLLFGSCNLRWNLRKKIIKVD